MKKEILCRALEIGLGHLKGEAMSKEIDSFFQNSPLNFSKSDDPKLILSTLKANLQDLRFYLGNHMGNIYELGIEHGKILEHYTKGQDND